MELRVALINPNTDKAITARMLAVARSAAGETMRIAGMTAPFGASLIVDEDDLARAAIAVYSFALALRGAFDGVIVSAFGDPGATALAGEVDCPVVGIGEAAVREAASGGRRFCIATTTPHLVASIERKVASLGLAGQFAGVVLTAGDAKQVTNDPEVLEQELAAAVGRAADERGAQAVVIGGGPLADAARALTARGVVAVIEPIPAAVRRVAALIREDRREPAR